MIDKRFFCLDQQGNETDCFATHEEAVVAGCTLEMAPFTVYEYRPYPVGLRQTNAMGEDRFKVRVHDKDGKSSSAA